MIALIIVLVICAYESLTKGWYTLVLAPASIIAFPLEFFLQFLAIRFNKKSPSLPLKGLIWAQLLAFLAFYVSIVGFGDTQDVLLFGFLPSTVTSPLTSFSSTLTIISTVSVPILSLALILRLTVYSRFGGRGKALAWILGGVIIALAAFSYYYSESHQTYYCNGQVVSQQDSENCGHTISE